MTMFKMIIPEITLCKITINEFTVHKFSVLQRLLRIMNLGDFFVLVQYRIC
jgi:hypothetical protein